MTASVLQDRVGGLVESAAALYGNKVALIFEGQTWTFDELNDASLRVAAFLQAAGVKQGERVSLYSPNCPEWVIAYYGIMKAGAVVNPLNLMLTPEEASYAMSDCEAVAVFGAGDLLEKLEPAIDRSQVKLCISFSGTSRADGIRFSSILDTDPFGFEDPDIVLSDICTVGYTSGTTGHPKGALLSHRAILTNTSMTATMHVRTHADVVVSALPCSHVYGNIVMNAAIAYGMTLVLHKSFDVERVLQSIQDHRATLFEGVPTMYMYLLNSSALNRFDLSSITRCTVGGQTMPKTKMAQVEKAFNCPLLELWGMTELGGLGATHSFYGPRRHGSIGVPLPSLEARIVSTDGANTVMRHDQVGELQIRGAVTMSGYLGRPEATKEVLGADGWLHTGDLAYQDRDGYLFVVDRLKDMIITGGFNIYPAELERVLAAHPDVCMVAVAGVIDEEKGELAKAYVVAREGASIDLHQLDQHCRAHLAAYKVPRLYQLVSSLPTTSTGKVMRRMLKLLDA